MYRKAKLHFKKADPVLHKIALQFEIDDIRPSSNLFRDIVWTIVGQQLSGKAADTIFERFEALFPKKEITAKKILKLSDIKMRKAGLSGAKGRAIKDLAGKTLSGEVNLKKLPRLNDEEVLIELIKVKGIGPWTAEMILMFSLGRTDIFSPGDLGLQKGMMYLYNLKKFPSEKKLTSITKLWSPYRTYAAKVLWKLADSKKPRIARKRE